MAPRRARRRLAGQGRAPAGAAGGRGRAVPRRAGRHARGAAARGRRDVAPAGVTLRPRPRGFHLVTREVRRRCPSCGGCRSACRTCSSATRRRRSRSTRTPRPTCAATSRRWFNEAVPEDAPLWTHTIEGPDDMPAHIKASLLGPVADAAGRATGASRSAPGRASTCASTATAAAPRRCWSAPGSLTADAASCCVVSAPPQTGSRFSANAVAPSRASSEANTGPAISPWRSQNSSSVQSPAAARIRLVASSASGPLRGDRARRARARRRAPAPGSASAVDDAELAPPRSARDRVAGQRQLHRQVVRDPARQAQQRAARRHQRPRLTSGMPSCASLAATIRSQASAISKPPATAKPSIAAISGLRGGRWAIPAKPRSPTYGPLAGDERLQVHARAERRRRR